MSQKPSRREFVRRALAFAGGWSLASSALGQTPTPQVKAPKSEAAPPKGPSGPEDYIDSHVHVWTPDTNRYPLAKGFYQERIQPPSFTPEELLAEAKPQHVNRIVLVQVSFYGNNNAYMLEAIQKHPDVFAGIGRVSLKKSPRDAMLKLAGQGVRGFRITPGKTDPARWLEGEPMASMWKTAAEKRLAICALLDPHHLPALDRMCEKSPSTTVVIDHLARIGHNGLVLDEDIDSLCRLAKHRNLHVKISAFYALGLRQPPYKDLGPLVKRVLEAFGPQRLMWGSDSPFQLLHGHAYQGSLDLIRKRLGFITAAQKEWLLKKTAERVFFAR